MTELVSAGENAGEAAVNFKKPMLTISGIHLRRRNSVARCTLSFLLSLVTVLYSSWPHRHPSRDCGGQEAKGDSADLFVTRTPISEFES